MHCALHLTFRVHAVQQGGLCSAALTAMCVTEARVFFSDFFYSWVHSFIWCSSMLWSRNENRTYNKLLCAAHFFWDERKHKYKCDPLIIVLTVQLTIFCINGFIFKHGLIPKSINGSFSREKWIDAAHFEESCGSPAPHSIRKKQSVFIR